MNEMSILAQETTKDVENIEKHPSFKPYLGFESKIASNPSLGGNIRVPKKPRVTWTK
ncbi:MAG: hypothetical protein LBD23_09505 [Oscillospiraceae bacterium]|jgi:hypothetical protein|nr:hypothetical protein [Oscillospiraceae bacterium]